MCTKIECKYKMLVPKWDLKKYMPKENNSILFQMVCEKN
jgi:hypothetical protein